MDRTRSVVSTPFTHLPPPPLSPPPSQQPPSTLNLSTSLLPRSHPPTSLKVISTSINISTITRLLHQLPTSSFNNSSSNPFSSSSVRLRLTLGDLKRERGHRRWWRKSWWKRRRTMVPRTTRPTVSVGKRVSGRWSDATTNTARSNGFTSSASTSRILFRKRGFVPIASRLELGGTRKGGREETDWLDGASFSLSILSLPFLYPSFFVPYTAFSVSLICILLSFTIMTLLHSLSRSLSRPPPGRELESKATGRTRRGP